MCLTIVAQKAKSPKYLSVILSVNVWKNFVRSCSKSFEYFNITNKGKLSNVIWSMTKIRRSLWTSYRIEKTVLTMQLFRTWWNKKVVFNYIVYIICSFLEVHAELYVNIHNFLTSLRRFFFLNISNYQR